LCPISKFCPQMFLGHPKKPVSDNPVSQDLAME
jgi:hypothetical protein